MLKVENLTVQYLERTVIDEISFSAAQNRWLMLVGPNGAGKSTIVNAISGIVGYEGEISICDENLLNLKPAILAKKVGVLAQGHSVSYSFTVEEIVKMGRYSYRNGIFSSFGLENEDAVKTALEMTGLSELKNRSALTLSGGELQRTFLAQVFAQDPKLLILDEPANHLDLVYQEKTFELIKT